MRDELSSADFDIIDLWVRGKYWEIFSLVSNDFTTLELAKQYSDIRKEYANSPEDLHIIDEVFSTLNAPLTRQFYEGCRMVMQRIRRELGDEKFQGFEDRIWADLWNWVSERWQEPPEEIIVAIRTKYSDPSIPDSTKSEKWSHEGLEPADLDSVMAAEAFAKEAICQGCGRFDHTLRAVYFPYIVSILIASFKRAGEPGIYCHKCRSIKSYKWAIICLIFGWWSIWGFFWNIAALIDNFRGGKIPSENNIPLLSKLVWSHMALGKIAEAKAALKALLKIEKSEQALRLKQELNTKYPDLPAARAGDFRLGYLITVFTIIGLYVIAGIAMFSDDSPAPSPRSQPISNSQPVSAISSTSQPSEIKIPLSSSNNNGEYLNISYDEVLQTVSSFINDIAIQCKTNKSDRNAMSVFKDRLIEHNIEAGLVFINSEFEAPGNLDCCVAVKTNDRNTIFLTILPGDMDLVDENERLQCVYLEESKRIGIIPATLSKSNNYEWYENYLDEMYEYYSYTEYLDAFGNIIDKNESRLDEIDRINEKIISYIEDPPLLTQYLNDYEYERANREFDRLIELADERLNRYNDVFIVQFNGQIADYNKKISIADKLSSSYPNEIFYVKEYFATPNEVYTIQPPLFSTIPLPDDYLVTPSILYTNVDSFLDALESMINTDDSYNQIPKPDRSKFQTDRITDSNFIVDDFKIKW